MVMMVMTMTMMMMMMIAQEQHIYCTYMCVLCTYRLKSKRQISAVAHDQTKGGIRSLVEYEYNSRPASPPPLSRRARADFDPVGWLVGWLVVWM